MTCLYNDKIFKKRIDEKHDCSKAFHLLNE